MATVFGRRSGKKGRNGFKWADVTNPEILARVKHLHPLIYQHDPRHMPAILKVKFAKGIVHEQQHGIGLVNWAQFAEVVNRTQRRQRSTRTMKLEYVKKCGMSTVTKEDLKLVKVELPLGMGAADGWKKDTSKVCGSRIPIKQEDDIGIRRAERMERMGDSIRLLNLEIESNKATLAATSSTRKTTKDAVKVYKANSKDIKQQLTTLEDEQWDNPAGCKFEKEFLENAQKRNNDKMETAVAELQGAVAEKEVIDMRLDLQQRQLSVVNDELQHLKFGGQPSGLQLWPLLYPPPKDCPITHIAVTVCALCAFPFPNHDIIVANCKHVYHPWCAMVVFSKGRGKACVHRGCHEQVHPNWHQSFGWRILAEDLQKRATELDLDGESIRLLQQREELGTCT